MQQDLALMETVTAIMAAWLLLAGASYWSQQQQLGLSKSMLWASVRAPLQLLALGFILHWLFDIRSHWAQAGVIAVFCLLAAHNAAQHHARFQHAWLAAAVGLMAACLLTLPWLVFSHAFRDDARSIIPLGSMVAANAMNAVCILFDRLKPNAETGNSVTIKEGLRTAMISPINTLKVVGLVHMPGIFVGMVLAGSPVFAAIAMQLVVLYMIVASSFIACIVSFMMMKHLDKGIPEP